MNQGFEPQASESNHLLENHNLNVNTGKVIGPTNVLIYDTSLRGMCYCLFSIF